MYDFKSEIEKVYKIFKTTNIINIYGVEYIGKHNLFTSYQNSYNSIYDKIFFLKNMTDVQRFFSYENTFSSYKGIYLLGTDNYTIANYLCSNIEAKYKLILLTTYKCTKIPHIMFLKLQYHSNLNLFTYYIDNYFYNLRPWRKLKIDQNTLLDLFNTACNKDPFQFHNFLISTSKLFVQAEYDKFIFTSCIKDNLNRSIPDMPQNTKIIVSEVNEQLLYKILQNPKLLHNLSPFNFEHIIAKIFEKKGFSVKITPKTHDGGKDIFIAKNDLMSFLFYVECKKYSPDHPVGIEVIQRLYGVISAEKATGGIIATTSYFTKPAKNYIKEYNLEHQITLQDFDDISHILKTL